MDWLDSLLTYLGIGGLGIGALLGAAWFFGLMPVIGAVANVLAAVLGPILGAVVQGIVWAWQNIIWPGLWDILDNWVTILTVVLMGGFLYLATASRYEVQEYFLERQIQVCEANLKKARKAIPPARRPAPETFKWPWE